jgi:hypothetical protein
MEINLKKSVLQYRTYKFINKNQAGNLQDGNS